MGQLLLFAGGCLGSDEHQNYRRSTSNLHRGAYVNAIFTNCFFARKYIEIEYIEIHYEGDFTKRWLKGECEWYKVNSGGYKVIDLKILGIELLSQWLIINFSISLILFF